MTTNTRVLWAIPNTSIDHALIITMLQCFNLVEKYINTSICLFVTPHHRRRNFLEQMSKDSR